MAFYKKQNEELLVSEFVDGQGYTLSEAGKYEHQYPVDGWYWFDSLDNAIAGLANTVPSTSLTPRQFRLQLLSLGLLDEVEARAAADKATSIWFEYSLDFQREHPMIEAMAVQLGLTQDDMDNFFIEASKL